MVALFVGYHLVVPQRKERDCYQSELDSFLASSHYLIVKYNHHYLELFFINSWKWVFMFSLSYLCIFSVSHQHERSQPSFSSFPTEECFGGWESGHVQRLLKALEIWVSI